MDIDLYSEPIPIPRGGVQFPLELRPPPGFVAEDKATWPRVEGRLEFVGGRLLYMPPCGDDQQDVSVSVAWLFEPWAAAHADFVVGGNEAGMLLGGEIRGADLAVWRRADLGANTGGLRRIPPVLAVEVAGLDEDEPALSEKVRWYFDHGVLIVWVVLPQTREVVVLGSAGERRYKSGDRLAPQPELPGLEPAVDAFFRQLPLRP